MTEEKFDAALEVRRRGELLATEVDGEIVALNVENGTCYGFNGTATHIWSMIDRPRRLGDLRDALLEEFDVDRATCEAQLMDLLGDLARDGLVELRPAEDVG